MSKDIKYHRSPHTFFASNVSFVLPHLSKSPFRGYAIGNAAEQVASYLLRHCSAYLSLFGRLRLVNVKSWHTGFSYGEIPVGDKRPAINHLVFTFAIGRPRNGFVPASQLRERILSNRVSIYGDYVNGVQFISVGLNSQQCAQFHISNLQPRSLRYVYNTAGAVLRSVFRRAGRVDLDPADIQDQHEHLIRSRPIDQMPVANVFQMHYERWILQRSIWMLCPNLIAGTMINPWSTSVALSYIDSPALDYKNAAFGMVWDDEDSNNSHTLFSNLDRSMLYFISAVNSSNTRLPDQSGLLFPGLLASLILEGKVAVRKDIKEIYGSMVSAFDERGEELSKLFEPYDLTLRRMMRGDPATVAKLVEALDIFGDN